MPERNFGQDVEFLRQYVETIVLRNQEGAAVAVVPEYQGRTMTSASAGDEGASYGYLNDAAIANRDPTAKINLVGGEDRVWISPEGSQYSIFFDPGVDMSFENWRTPPVLDTVGFDVIEQTPTTISLQRDASLTNWTGTEFEVRIGREVALLDRVAAAGRLDTSLDSVSVVAHESRNTLTNLGDRNWEPESGLIGIWMLCMSKPSPAATLIVPFATRPDETLDSVPAEDIVTSNYFGELHDDRLKIDRQRQLLYLLGDGKHRSKLGLSFGRATSRLGSWDPARGVLSIVDFNLPAEVEHGYNNNLWAPQPHPYAGDVINCYNDGLNESGSSLAEGGFYELETISPALALASGDSYTHRHGTIRMEGDREALDQIARAALGVDLATIESQFG